MVLFSGFVSHRAYREAGACTCAYDDAPACVGDIEVRTVSSTVFGADDPEEFRVCRA